MERERTRVEKILEILHSRDGTFTAGVIGTQAGMRHGDVSSSLTRLLRKIPHLLQRDETELPYRWSLTGEGKKLGVEEIYRSFRREKPKRRARRDSVPPMVGEPPKIPGKIDLNVTGRIDVVFGWSKPPLN